MVFRVEEICTCNGTLLLQHTNVLKNWGDCKIARNNPTITRKYSRDSILNAMEGLKRPQNPPDMERTTFKSGAEQRRSAPKIAPKTAFQVYT